MAELRRMGRRMSKSSMPPEPGPVLLLQNNSLCLVVCDFPDSFRPGEHTQQPVADRIWRKGSHSLLAVCRDCECGLTVVIYATSTFRLQHPQETSEEPRHCPLFPGTVGNDA